MPTTVVGYRLGNDMSSRQTTLIVTENGLRHRAHGLYGCRGTVSKPAVGSGQNPVHAQVAHLRQEYATALRRDPARVLIPPASVRLDLDEPPLAERPYGPDAPPPHPALIDAFIDAAPSTHRELEEAIHDFYTAIGAPTRPLHPGPPFSPASVPPQVAQALRTLAHGRPVHSTLRGVISYTVTPGTVRLHVGRAGEDLDYRQVLHLQAALTAWLHLNRTHRS